MSIEKVSKKCIFSKFFDLSKQLLRYLEKLNLFDTFTDKGNMKLAGEYLTISEMAERLEISYLTAKQRLLRAGIKPVTKDVLYPVSALEAIRNVPGKGRPPKGRTGDAP